MLSESWRPSLKHTHMYTAVFVFIYHSSSRIDDNKRRHRVCRIERVRNTEGKRRKESKVAEKKRNGAEALLKNGSGKPNGKGKDRRE